MIEVAIKTTEGKEVGILEFPERPEEISLKQMIEFEKSFSEKERWLESLGDSPDYTSVEFRVGYIKSVLACLEQFTGSKLVENMPIGNFESHLVQMLGVNSTGNIDLGNVEETLFQIYTNIWRILGQYRRPERFSGDISFTYQDVHYKITKAFKDAITQQVKFDSLPAGQVVEALEAWRLFEVNSEKDKDGSLIYTTLLRLIACFALADGEAFPSSDIEAQKWLSDRSILFSGIDMVTALNVQAFFLHTTKA